MLVQCEWEERLACRASGDAKNCKWIYRFPANPGMPGGGIVPPTPVLAPGSRRFYTGFFGLYDDWRSIWSPSAVSISVIRKFSSSS